MEEGDRLRVWTDATDEQEMEANTTLFRRWIRRRRELLYYKTRCFFVFFLNAGQIKLHSFLFFLAVVRTVAYMTAISMQRDARRSLISLSNKITGAVGSVNHPSPRSVLRTLLFVSPPPHWTLVQSI